MDETDQVSRTNKRRNDSSNKRQAAKMLRNRGEAYTNRSGLLIQPRIFRNVDCLCRKGCSQNISEEARKKLFETFWRLGKFWKQNAHLCELVQAVNVDRHRPRKGTKPLHMVMNKFYLIVDSSTVETCKKFFLRTFSISDGRLTRALRKYRERKPTCEDLREQRNPNPRTFEPSCKVEPTK